MPADSETRAKPPSLERHHRKVAKVRALMANLIIGILCAAAMVTIFGILSEEGVGALLLKLFYTGVVLLAYSSGSYAYLSKSLKSTSVSANLYGVTIGGIVTLILIILLWVELDLEIYAKIALITLAALLATANIIGMMGLGMAPSHVWVRQVAHTFSVLMFFAASYLVIEEPKESNPWRYSGVLMVLTLLSTIVSWILSRLYTEVANVNLLGQIMGSAQQPAAKPGPPPLKNLQSDDAPAEGEKDEQFRFNCPHCEQSFSASTRLVGRDVECVNCGESIRVPEVS